MEAVPRTVQNEIILALFLAVQAFGDEVLEKEWKGFKAKHNKQYRSSKEETRRKAIFSRNLAQINEHNAKKASSLGYRMGINRFADMTGEEFADKYLNKLEVPSLDRSRHQTKSTPKVVRYLPESVDWRHKGAVTPVKDQMWCGSCWAFSATGAMESAYFIANGTLERFSEQQLVDCTRAYGIWGCQGGWMSISYNYVRDHGIERERDYPYVAEDCTCTDDASKFVTTLSGYTEVAYGSEPALQEAVFKQPVSVAVGANTWYLYESGVFNDTECTTDAQHAVLVVGYGTTCSGVPYWIIKNSWSSYWGEDGYIRIIRGYNRCGLTHHASYPNIEQFVR